MFINKRFHSFSQDSQTNEHSNSNFYQMKYSLRWADKFRSPLKALLMCLLTKRQQNMKMTTNDDNSEVYTVAEVIFVERLFSIDNWATFSKSALCVTAFKLFSLFNFLSNWLSLINNQYISLSIWAILRRSKSSEFSEMLNTIKCDLRQSLGKIRGKHHSKRAYADGSIWQR